MAMKRAPSTTANADTGRWGTSMEETDKVLSRRNMLLMAGGTVAAASAVIAAPFAKQIRRASQLVPELLVSRQPPSLANAGYQEWLSQVGSVFAVAGRTSMALVGVRPLPTSGARPSNVTRTQAFVAVFDPRGGTLAGDLIYTVLHPTYGALPIFLSAASDPRTPTRMLAVFN